MNIIHTPVMPSEVLNFIPENASIAVDATLGEGGHTKLLLDKGLEVHGFDRDEIILQKAALRFSEEKKLYPYNAKYDNIYGVLPKNLLGNIDFILFDLGVSMFHFKEAGRGFSFSEKSSLDMRLGLNDKTAYDVINHYSQNNLMEIFSKYGEIKYAKSMALSIIEKRNIKPIESTEELENIIFHSTPKSLRHSNTHPATKVFQAIRIEVNDELNILQRALSFLPKILKNGGVVVVISYHSLEDRIVKRYFKENENTKNKSSLFNILTRHPLTASEDEIEKNRASRSAKIRAASLV